MGYGSIQGSASLSNSLAADVQGLSKLKLEAGKQTPESIRETAKQFESLFMKELLKSMRDANDAMKSGAMDNSGSDLGTDLLDQQFALQMSGQRGGLSEMIAAQLSRQAGLSPEDMAKTKPSLPALPPGARSLGISSIGNSVNTANTAQAAPPVGRAPSSQQAAFVNKLSELAGKVEKDTGIPASYMIGQAGHETGWGKFEIKHKGGAPSYNLFGIKAGKSWTGPVAEITTTEYVNGVAQKQTAKFRAYSSYEESFRDYARLIGDSPRYAKVKLAVASPQSTPQAFASGLQKAGYATDPDYASKLSRAINTTLQLRRVQV